LLAAGFLAGIALLNQLSALPENYVLILLAASALLVLRLCWRWPTWRTSLCGLLLGFLYSATLAQAMLATRLPAEVHGTERWLRGHVIDLPVTDAGHGRSVTRFSFRVMDDELRKLRVAWYQAGETLAVGECWELRLKLRTPRGSRNPGAMDYEGWLFRQRIDAAASVREGRRCPDDAPALVGRLRSRIAQGIREALPEHTMRGFLLGLSIGDRSEIDDVQWRILRRTGVAHLLAISGLHIGLLAGFAFLLSRKLWVYLPGAALRIPAPYVAAIAAGLTGLLYAALAGFTLPTQRALVMLLLVLIGMLLGRRSQASFLFCWALLLVLVLDPFVINSAGFWLSFAAVGWILYVMRARLQPMPKTRAWLWLQLVLACGLFPLTLLWFGEGSWISPLVNLLLIPLFFLLVPLILLAALLSVAAPPVGGPLLQACATALQFVWAVLSHAEAVWEPVMVTTTPTVLGIALALLGLIWLFAPRGWPMRLLGMLLCLPLLLPQIAGYVGQSATQPSHGQLEMIVLDVGQGLAVVLRSRQHVLVYDAGPAYSGGFDAGAMVLVPYLRQLGVFKVDRYLQSHGDLDHRGGAGALRHALAVNEEVGTEAGIGCQQVEPWEWDGVQYELLHPLTGEWEGNNASCVLRVSVGSTVILLTGDIEKKAEAGLLRAQPEKLAADILLVPHHGSNTSSSSGFLNQVQPMVAIVSAGWRNRWGFPAPRVVRRYTARDIKLLNTAEEGAVILRIDPTEGVQTTHSYRHQERRFWHAD
jgi:competence protein ComEC